MPAKNIPESGRRARVLARLHPSDIERLALGQSLPLRINIPSDGADRVIAAIPAEGAARCDPSLHHALLDLASAIIEDIREACGAFNDPNIWYPGVDDGIKPVSDDHVELVTWALQRELDREPRRSLGGSHLRPAVPLYELPWRIKRAVAERRRLRYAQWGIGRPEWESNEWHPDNVPEDPDWKLLG